VPLLAHLFRNCSGALGRYELIASKGTGIRGERIAMTIGDGHTGGVGSMRTPASDTQNLMDGMEKVKVGTSKQKSERTLVALVE